MQTLRLFISSPSDVRDERQIAGKVIARLQGKYWSFVRLEDVFWERSVARATAHFQDELRNPGECDIVIGILWSRLGSPLPERFRGLRGEIHATGTEWELAQAFEAYEKCLQETGNPDLAKPDVIVYRRTDQPASGVDEAEVSRCQREALEAYLRREFHHDDIHGTIRRSLAHYQGLEEFEKRLHDDLEALILKRLPSLAPGFEPPPISGNPFMGLSVFGYDEADRFFGRTRAIREVRQRLCERADAGTAFVLIYGASGHGKSSLMRAGVAPAVTRPGGALEGMDRWRRVLLQPGVGSGGLYERLARAILATAPEEEIERARLNDRYVRTGFPELTAHGIPDPAAGGLTWDVAAFARYLAQPEDQVFAFAGIHEALEKEGLNLLLQIDQLEEVFAEGIGAEERASFFRALHGLSRGGRVWVLATLRSEFFPRIAGEDALRDLVGRDGGYILPPPDLQSWNEIVRYPALAARLDYEQQVAFREIGGFPTTEEWLHEQILADIGGNPDVLPLLEFCLQRLYLDLIDPQNPDVPCRGSRLTWESYAAMGGLRGAIATAADDAYKGLTSSERGARDYLFGNLVRVDDTVTRRRADLEAFAKRPGAAAFIAAFREAKLLVADEDEGRAVVTLAHESLLTHWPVLAEWIEEHRSDLAAHQRLIRQTDLWEQNGRSPTYLLSAGHLAEAERVAESPLFLLAEPEQELLRRSRAAARKRLRFFQAAAAVFALLATTAGVMGWMAEERKVRALTAEKEAIATLAASDFSEGAGFLSDPATARKGMAFLARAARNGHRHATTRLWTIFQQNEFWVRDDELVEQTPDLSVDELASGQNPEPMKSVVINGKEFEISWSKDGSRYVTVMNRDLGDLDGQGMVAFRVWDSQGRPVTDWILPNYHGQHSLEKIDSAILSDDGRLAAVECSHFREPSYLEIWDIDRSMALKPQIYAEGENANYQGAGFNSYWFAADDTQSESTMIISLSSRGDAAVHKILHDGKIYVIEEALRHKHYAEPVCSDVDDRLEIFASCGIDGTIQISAIDDRMLGWPIAGSGEVRELEVGSDRKVVAKLNDGGFRRWVFSPGVGVTAPMGELLIAGNVKLENEKYFDVLEVDENNLENVVADDVGTLKVEIRGRSEVCVLASENGRFSPIWRRQFEPRIALANLVDESLISIQTEYFVTELWSFRENRRVMPVIDERDAFRIGPASNQVRKTLYSPDFSMILTRSSLWDPPATLVFSYTVWDGSTGKRLADRFFAEEFDQGGFSVDLRNLVLRNSMSQNGNGDEFQCIQLSPSDRIGKLLPTVAEAVSGFVVNPEGMIEECPLNANEWLQQLRSAASSDER